MVQRRKKTTIDTVDRAILRFMRDARRGVTGRQIATKVRLSPPAIRPRLDSLQRKGIVKPVQIGKMRKGIMMKSGVTVRAPSRIKWGLDLLPSKKPQRRKK